MILALDPSMRYFGALLIDDSLDAASALAWWKSTSPDADDASQPLGDVRRVRELRSWLSELWLSDALSRSLPVVAVEIPSGSRGAGGHKCGCGGQHVPGIYRSAKAEGMVLSLVTTFFADRRVDVQWVQPQEVKLALLGKRSGSKDEVMAVAGPKLEGMVRPWSKLPAQARETIADCYGVAAAALESIP